MTNTDIDRIVNIIRTQDILRRHDFNFKKVWVKFPDGHNILSKITVMAEFSKSVIKDEKAWGKIVILKKQKEKEAYLARFKAKN